MWFQDHTPVGQMMWVLKTGHGAERGLHEGRRQQDEASCGHRKWMFSGGTNLRELEALPGLWEGFIHAEPRCEGQTGRLQEDCVRGLNGDTVLFKKREKTENV